MASLTNHLWACLLYAISFQIRLYGKWCLLTAHTAQLFCLPPHFACSLSFFCCIDSETQSGSFACLVMHYNRLCVYFTGLPGARCKSHMETATGGNVHWEFTDAAGLDGLD